MGRAYVAVTGRRSWLHPVPGVPLAAVLSHLRAGQMKLFIHTIGIEHARTKISTEKNYFKACGYQSHTV